MKNWESVQVHLKNKGIDYFVKSMNNGANNQIIVCPNHHSIIHDVDPVFDRGRLLYIYSNGFEEKLVLNQHL